MKKVFFLGLTAFLILLELQAIAFSAVFVEPCSGGTSTSKAWNPFSAQWLDVVESFECDMSNEVSQFSGKAALYGGDSSFQPLGVGMTFVGGTAGERRIILLLVVAAQLAGGGFFASCSGGGGGGGSGGPSALPADQMSYTASGLNVGTTYYWKVVADDGKGGVTESAVWSFITN